jgi:hypothetical protein
VHGCSKPLAIGTVVNFGEVDIYFAGLASGTVLSSGDEVVSSGNRTQRHRTARRAEVVTHPAVLYRKAKIETMFSPCSTVDKFCL